MRLGISEESEEACGRLNQLSSVSSKKWYSGIEDMNNVLKKGGRSAIMEVYSPPLVDALARMSGLMPGMSLDLTAVDPVRLGNGSR